MSPTNEEPTQGLPSQTQVIEHQLDQYDQLLTSLEQVIHLLEALQRGKDPYLLKKVSQQGLAYYRRRAHQVRVYYETMGGETPGSDRVESGPLA